jgi:hypothetical protein
MKKTIVVIDGMGGGIGAELVSRLAGSFPGAVEIVALGTNALATERMIKAGASRGASGENALRVSVQLGDYILGPIGIIIPNSMMGEITPGMAEAVLTAPGERILIPFKNDHFTLPGLEPLPLAKAIGLTIEALQERLSVPEEP